MMSAEDYRRAQRKLAAPPPAVRHAERRRYFYDFYQICFGPVPLAARVDHGDKLVLAFTKDGS